MVWRVFEPVRIVAGILAVFTVLWSATAHAEVLAAKFDRDGRLLTSSGDWIAGNARNPTDGSYVISVEKNVFRATPHCLSSPLDSVAIWTRAAADSAQRILVNAANVSGPRQSGFSIICFDTNTQYSSADEGRELYGDQDEKRYRDDDRRYGSPRISGSIDKIITAKFNSAGHFIAGTQRYFRRRARNPKTGNYIVRLRSGIHVDYCLVEELDSTAIWGRALTTGNDKRVIVDFANADGARQSAFTLVCFGSGADTGSDSYR